MLKKFRGYAASFIILVILLSGCVSAGGETDVTSNCGPAPQHPGFPIESKEGRVSMDVTTWRQLRAWMTATALWSECAEGL